MRRMPRSVSLVVAIVTVGLVSLSRVLPAQGTEQQREGDELALGFVLLSSHSALQPLLFLNHATPRRVMARPVKPRCRRP